MSDSSCGYNFSPAIDAAQPQCGATVTSPPQSPVARLLGQTAVTPYAFNHPPSHAWGYIDLPHGSKR